MLGRYVEVLRPGKRLPGTKEDQIQAIMKMAELTDERTA